MRLDIFLLERGLASSRTEAKGFIQGGAVTVGARCVIKPSYEISEDCADVSVDRSVKKYASRGGFKLAGALTEFKIDVGGKLAIDIGASSGGFTDCLLQNGASHVISVDSGSGQLAEFLRKDERVTVIENYNARYMKPDDFEYRPQIAVMDVSFISATYIIEAIAAVLADNGEFVCLVKPQFEVGRQGLGKGGIVKDDKIRKSALKKVVDFAVEHGFEFVSSTTSPIKGGDGNTEYLAYFRKRI